MYEEQSGRPVAPPKPPFQFRVDLWLMFCFGEEIARNKQERNHRFLEEALELVQACECTREEAHLLVDYVFGRPVGEKEQEVGGVMVTLAALCMAHGMSMEYEGETELTRITDADTMIRIRAKQAAKPKNTPLPQEVIYCKNCEGVNTTQNDLCHTCQDPKSPPKLRQSDMVFRKMPYSWKDTDLNLGGTK